MSEDQLIENAQQGNLNDFRRLMEPHSRVIWRVMKVQVADPVLAEGCVQEAWVEIWRRLPDFSGDMAFRSWLLTVMAPCSQKRLRPQSLAILQSEQRAFPLQKQEKPRQPGFAEAKLGLEMVLRRLPLQQRRLFMLHFYAGLDITEIALVLQRPQRNVAIQWQGALQSLKSRFAEDHALTALLHRYMESSDE